MTTPGAARVETTSAITFLPGARAEDAAANYWLCQVTLRLRREVCWLWRERGSLAGVEPGTALLPPFADRATAALDLTRYERDKRHFFSRDVTARHLTELITAAPDDDAPIAIRGSFGWLAQVLDLEPVDRFVLAAALLPLVDSAAGSVIATCLNDPSRGEPTLALAQRLWDEPAEVVARFDPAHPLVRYGVLPATAPGWDTPLIVPALVGRELLFPGTKLPSALERLEPGDQSTPPRAMARLAAGRGDSRRIVPLIGAEGTPLTGIAAACAREEGRDVVTPAGALRREELPHVLTVAWLRGAAVYLNESLLVRRGHEETVDLPLPGLPLTVFVGMHDRATLKALGGPGITPPILVPSLDYRERLACWRGAVPAAASDSGLDAALAEVARRFRSGREAISRAGSEVSALGRAPVLDDFIAACRGDVDLGALAQEVVPRFRLEELMLPPAQTTQIEEIVAAMTNLTRVHYEWGTARAWNESGLAVLFAGPPGTGKTMAAEALAATLRLPLYRIDLSQVVNKYIGETEKNLRRLFDAADASDVMLFFDEADALFGKRTEVKDAHDRYANLEVSYLLERMERFKGLAILATNRKKDLDDAFLRRLRFVVDFPLPGVAERLRIWQTVIPEGVDATQLDLPFLAQRFALAGGHIRAIVFHACLQSAGEHAARVLTMPVVIRAVRREFDKLDRAISLDQFGPYAPLVTAEGLRR
jgi:vesicle-fusing ATPase